MRYSKTRIRSRVAFLIFSVILLLSFTNANTFAEEKNDLIKSEKRYSIVSVDGIEMLKDSVERKYITNPVLADGTEISLQEYKNMKEASEKSQIMMNLTKEKIKNKKVLKERSVQPFGIWYNLYEYDEWYGGTYLAPPVPVSAALNCHGYPNQTPCTISASNTVTTIESWQFNVEASWKSVIKAGATYRWANVATSSATYTHPIPPGYTANLQFEPKIGWSSGEMTIETYWNLVLMETRTEITSGEGPITLSNGLHDGVFSLAFHY